jgi:hypothetical protein
MFAKFYMLKSPQGTKKTSSKMLWTKLVDKGIYNIPLNIAHLIAPKKKKKKTLLLHSILAHQDSNYCTTYTTQDSNFTYKNPKCSYGPRKVGNNCVCKELGFCVCNDKQTTIGKKQLVGELQW